MWDGRGDSGQGTSAGVYIYRLTSGEFAAARKMVLTDGASDGFPPMGGARGKPVAVEESRAYLVAITGTGIVPFEERVVLDREHAEMNFLVETRPLVKESYLEFSAEDSHVNVLANNSLIVDDGLTLEACVNRQGDGGVGPRVIEIIDTFTMHFERSEVWFCLYSTEFETNQGNNWHCLSSDEPAANKWVHLAGSWNGQTMFLLVDGVMVGETAFPGPLFHGGPGDQNLKIGNGWTLIDGFDGYIDEVRFSSIGRYDRAFVPPETQHLPDQYTVGLWHFNEGQGVKVMDDGDNGNDGSISGSISWGMK